MVRIFCGAIVFNPIECAEAQPKGGSRDGVRWGGCGGVGGWLGTGEVKYRAIRAERTQCQDRIEEDRIPGPN